MRMPNVFYRFKAFALKSLTIIRDNFIPIAAISQAIFGRTAEKGLSSNVVMAPVMWIMRTFTEAVAVVERRGDRGLWTKVIDHSAEMLIERPNEAYDGDALWKATVLSYVLDGNAYWQKVRNSIGEVIQLWYVPHWMIKPVGDSETFITHYEYSGGAGPTVRIAPRDIVHFRFGLDPEDLRYGLSPLRPVLREVMTDDQAAMFSESILRNMGIPGLVISPKGDAWKPSGEEVDKLRDYFSSAFSGDRTGRPLVMKIPTDVNQFGFDPNKLMLGNLRDISEERVCAAFGVPSAVVGFGSGLQSTKVGATMRELRKLAWVQCIIPMQTAMARQATAQLLPDFVAQRRRFRIAFDKSDVSTFPEDDAMRSTMIEGQVRTGLLRFDQAQEKLGIEVDPARAKYVDELIGALPEGQAVVAPKPEPAEPEPNEPPDDTDTTDDTKALLAIARRRGFVVTSNGNGHHS
jgi:HK97 family phage portal protein